MLATNSMNKNIRDLHRRIHEFKRGCQPASNLVKDEIPATFGMRGRAASFSY
jgi:hypothetical protein